MCVVVGNNGSGLTNVLSCDTPTRVIEIGDITFVRPSYLDGAFIPETKATRTYFHVLAEGKGLSLKFLESQACVADNRRLTEPASVSSILTTYVALDLNNVQYFEFSYRQ
jgi:hypothetical protein